MINLKNTAFANLNPISEDDQTSERVLVAGKMNFKVAKVELRGRMEHYPNPESDFEAVAYIDFPFYRGIVRTDTFQDLGVMSHKYGLVQNHQVLALTDVFAKEQTARYVAAGAPNRGERIFVVMDTGHVFNLGTEPQDEVRNLFFLTSSHDGSNAIVAYPTPVYMRTGAVLIAPDQRHGAIKIRHTKNVMQYVAKAEKLFSKLMAYWQGFTDNFVLLKDTIITNSTAEYFLEEVYSPEEGDSVISAKIRKAVFESYTSGPTASLPYCRGTLLGLYLACAWHADNVATVRKSHKRDAKAAETYSRLMGTQAANKAEALAFCLQLQKKLKGSR